MKTSTYITIAFLVFFFGTVTAIHIDSKLYEPEYKRIQLIRTNYYEALRAKQNKELTLEKWNEYISNTSNYFSEFGVFPNEMNIQAGFVYSNYKKFNDLKALKLAASWCEAAYKKEPKNHHLNDTYGCISFELGDIEKAVKLETYAVKRSRELNDGYIKWYEPRLKKFKKALNEKSNKE